MYNLSSWRTARARSVPSAKLGKGKGGQATAARFGANVMSHDILFISLHDLYHSHHSLNSPGSQGSFSSRSRRGT